MRIIGHMVMRNEADRFLERTLVSNMDCVDDMHVYDDRSDDSSVNVALRHTDLIGVRPVDAVPFAEDESEFRQAAWQNMIDVCKPTVDDWILAIDADEFILGNHADSAREALEKTIEYTEAVNCVAAALKRVIVWEWAAVPMIRTDGFWMKDRQARLVKFNPKAKTFRKGNLGCGSLPQYAYKSLTSTVTYSYIMDLGYALEGEPERKHAFYSSREGDMHNKAHIDSIIQTPQLMEWRSDVPCLTQ